MGELVGLLPKIGAGKECVLERGARTAFQVQIAELVVERSAGVLVRQVDTRDTLVIGGQSEWHVCAEIVGQRMSRGSAAEDDVVRGEIHLDHDVACGEFLEEQAGVGLLQDVDAMPDAFRVAEIDRLTDMEAQPRRRNQAKREFTGMQADMHARVDAVQVVEHKHLAVILAHGEIGVLGLNEVEPDHVRIGGGDLKGQQRLREDLLRRKGAQYLVEDAHLDRAGGCGARIATVLDAFTIGEVPVDLFTIGYDFVAQPGGEEFVAQSGKFWTRRSQAGRWSGTRGQGYDCRRRGPAELIAKRCRVRERRRDHHFEILLILGCGAGGELVQPLAAVGFVIQCAEAVEGGKELVVPADAGRWNEGAHGERVDHGVVELAIAKD